MQSLNAGQGLRCPGSTCPHRPITSRPLPLVVVRAGSATSQDFASPVTVRPYTLRKGDTLESIASKRDMSVKDILAINPDAAKSAVAEGQTILLPSNKLSKRDKEILGGIGLGYRVYPVRAGETLTDIMSKRGITKAEMDALNPGTDLSKLTANQLIKLPTNKFTVREREMLIGAKVLPPEFFHAASNPFVIGLGVLMAVCGFVLAWQRFQTDKDMLADE